MPKLTTKRPSFGLKVSITALVWQFMASHGDTGLMVGASASAAADGDSLSLRKPEDLNNITLFVTSYEHCDARCVTNIESGHRKSCLGVAGDDCAFPYEICPDYATQCFGPIAVCMDNAGNNTGYHCDCKAPFTTDKSSVIDDELIQDCLGRITEVCEKDQTVSHYAFCTNGGRCIDQIEPGEPHPGCDCPGRFVGRHCEKRRGTGREYRIDPTSVKVDELNEVVDVDTEHRDLGIFLSSAAAGFLICAAVLYRRFLSQRDAPFPDIDNSRAKMKIRVKSHDASDNISVLEIH